MDKITKSITFLFLGFLLVIIFWKINIKASLTISLAIIASIIKVIRVHKYPKLTFEPAFFFSIILTKYYRVEHSILLILITDFVVDFSINQVSIWTFRSFGLQILLNVLALIFVDLSIQSYGISLFVIYMLPLLLISLIISKLFSHKMIIMPGKWFLVQMAYFQMFGDIMEKILLAI